MDKAKTVLKKYTMIIALIIVTLFFAWGTDGKMLLPQNVNNLIAQNAYVLILATGMLLCILTGGNIDLSVGSIVCLVGAIGGTLMVNMRVNVFLAIISMLVVGLLIGIWQGFWIAYIRIPPFIVTLAGMLLWRGLALVILNGLTIAPLPDNYLVLFNSYIPDIFGGTINITCILIGVISCIIYIVLQIRGRINKAQKGYEMESMSSAVVKMIIISIVIMAFVYSLAQYKGIPMVLVWIGVIVMIYAYVTSKTVVGRHFYAVGGNEKATKLSGINTNRIYFIAYVNMAFLSAVAALVTIARLNSANPTAGTNYEMDAIGSCFIGGASAYGGIGTVGGVVVGAILMGVINLGMSIMGVDANYQKVVKGLVLLAAVIFDVLSKKNSK